MRLYEFFASRLEGIVPRLLLTSFWHSPPSSLCPTLCTPTQALARLLYEFASRLEGTVPRTVPRLLPAVLMLLRTRSREVVKSVLGFVKVSRHLIHRPMIVACTYTADCITCDL